MLRGRWKRGQVIATVVLLSVGGVVAGPRAVGASTVSGVDRLAGSDRYATSAAVSAATFPAGVPVAYVASGAGFPDAVAAGAAAAHRHGPVLLVPPTGIPPAVASELERLEPAQVVVVGGYGQVSATTESALRAFTTGEVFRCYGLDRYETSVAVSAGAFGAGVPVAYVATGAEYPDALSGGAAAALTGGPVLLVSPTSLPVAVARELVRLQPQRIVVLGGPGAVSDPVASALTAYAGDVTRVAGEDRYATSAAVSRSAFAPDIGEVFVATGQAFPDALSGTPAAGAAQAPVLLVRGTSVPASVEAELTRLRPRHITVLGGQGALSDAVLATLAGTVYDPARDHIPPGPVTDLTATATAPWSVTLSWTNPSDPDLVGVVVRRAEGTVAPATPSDGTGVAVGSAPVTTVVDAKVAGGHTYTYAVFATDPATNHSVAATVTLTMPPDGTPPGPVTDIVVKGRTSTSITLWWQDPTDPDLSGVTVRRAEGPVPPASPADGTYGIELGVEVRGFTNTLGLSPGTQYSYSFFAHDGVPNYAPAATITVSTAP